MSLLEIQNLSVTYPNGTKALKSISFSANRGEIIAVIGRSGAGKSTLLRCVNGLQPTNDGSITLDGQNLTRMNEDQLVTIRRHIGFVWQEYNLVGRLPVMANVLCGRLGYNSVLKSAVGFFQKQHREVALRNLERVNLMHRATQRADQLSGGEKQRVSIARAMSQEPKIILADEPVASLDPELAWQVMNDLARVAREDKVLTLINLHQVDLARAFVDRLIGVAQGVVVFDGPPDKLDDAALHEIYRFDKQPNAMHRVPVNNGGE
jgi:phosphonate transport system ATP-binding protein